MKVRKLIILSFIIIAIVAIGGYAFAKNPVLLNNRESALDGPNTNHCGINEEMVQIMEANGFGDMIEWMRQGNFKEMNDYMNNISDQDYQRMIDVMEENGLGSMSQMMESMGREGMIKMHNSMMGDSNSKSNMMKNMMGFSK